MLFAFADAVQQAPPPTDWTAWITAFIVGVSGVIAAVGVVLNAIKGLLVALNEAKAAASIATARADVAVAHAQIAAQKTEAVGEQVTELHGMVNDRLSQLVATTAVAEHAKGVAAERARADAAAATSTGPTSMLSQGGPTP
jgi:hypothetical protein